MDRRRFLELGLATTAWAIVGPTARAGTTGSSSELRLAAHHSSMLGASHTAALFSSPFVYVSPLKRDGTESACHGEVWFAWLDSAVVVTVAADRWKARAIEQGLSKARLWVGDYGRWKRLAATNDEFRKGPSFTARSEISIDDKLHDRLIATYDRKYPKEIGKWRDKMREGFADGSRKLIRYVPEAELAPEGARLRERGAARI